MQSERKNVDSSDVIIVSSAFSAAEDCAFMSHEAFHLQRLRGQRTCSCVENVWRTQLKASTQAEQCKARLRQMALLSLD